ncbi:MAG: PQQ-binding-like beta-propeller repeat protein [Actinomycetota bacterium]|nr:PQQ-binding-like beta-propeller repeat protein [Actinomycetota bacterium]
MLRSPKLVVSVVFVVACVAALAGLSGSSHHGAAAGASPSRDARAARAAPPRSATHGRVVSRSTRSGSGLPFPLPPKGLRAGPNLQPGSNPSVLPSDVLIADRSNSRLLVVSPSGRIVWQFPQPGDLAPGQTFLIPDDAFFTPNGKDILVTEEDDQVVSLIDIATHRIVWRYGTPGVPGNTLNHLDNPDDALMTPNGDVVLADIKNCSILVLHPPSHVPVERIGENDIYCYHQPPLRWGSPNGVFPMTNGDYIATEINGDWVDEMTLGGKVLWSTHPPGVAYPSDTNQVGPNRFLTADYSDPGQIVEFTSTGKLLWRYRPTSGPGMLNQPSLCRPIPNSPDVLCNDDYNDRVIVIDSLTNKIVWQYGHTGVRGTAPGYLNQPDGVDLAPPASMTVEHAKTMTEPPTHCVVGVPVGTCTFGIAAA